MNTSVLETFLTNNFQDIAHRQPKKIYAAYLKRREQLVSLYYFDYSQCIEAEGFDINAYQEANIAADYYANNSSLQWNINLIFVVSSECRQRLAGSLRLSEIEGNRLYCRKQICSLEDLDALFPLTSGKVFAEGQQSGTDITIRWRRKLDTAGIGDIMSETPIAQVVREIITPAEKTKGASEISLSSKTINDPAGNNVCFAKLEIEQYRKKLVPHTFNLGSVNLLTGPNGAGKTSFLEAIELCLCGQTLRGGEEPGSRIKYWTVEGSQPGTLALGENRLYQSRDLRWYNNRYSRGNHLPHGFSKFNFYDTDQAYRLARNTDPNEIRDAFTSLALGEQVNFFDERIREVRRKLTDELARREEGIATLTLRIQEDKAEIETLKQDIQQPEPILAVLQKELKQLSWNGPILDPEQKNLPEIEAGLLEVRALLQGVLQSTGSWLYPLSKKVLAENTLGLSEILKKVSAIQPTLNQLTQEITLLGVSLKEKTKLLNSFNRATGYAKNGGLADIIGLDEHISRSEYLLASFDNVRQTIAQINLDSYRNDHTLLEKYIQELTEQCETTRKKYKQVTSTIEKTQTTMDHLSQLKANLKQIGIEVITLRATPDECPLCHAHYASGELARRIESTDEATAVSVLEELLSLRTQLNNDQVKAKQCLEDVTVLKHAFCEYSGKVPNKDSDLAYIVNELDSISEVREAVLKTKEQAMLLRDSLISKGLSEQDLLTIVDELTSVVQGFDIRTQTEESLSVFSVQVSDQIRELQEKLTQLTSQRNLNEKSILDDCQTYIGQTPSLEVALPRLQMKTQQCQKAFEDVEVVAHIVNITESTILADLLSIIERTSGCVGDIRKINTDVQNRSKSISLRKKTIEKSSAELREKQIYIERIKKALKPLEDIVKTDSKEKALETFFANYKSRILQIFKTIHSPREFEDISISEREVSLTKRDGQVCGLRVCKKLCVNGPITSLA